MPLPPGLPFDRRSEPRSPSAAAARVWYGAGYEIWADGRLRDVSTGGARIELPTAHALPTRLALVHELAPTIFEAVVRWRRGNAVGLSFEARHALSGDIGPRLQHIRDTWLALYPAAHSPSQG